MTDKVLLETTICIDRIFESSDIIQKIETYLKDKELYTTSYVLGELKNNILSEICKFHNILLTNSYSDTVNLYDRNNFSLRKSGRLRKIIAYSIKGLKVPIDSTLENEILDRLEIYIEDFRTVMFPDIPESHILNETKCKRGSAQYYKDTNTKKLKIDTECVQANCHDCKINDFFIKHNNSLEEILNLTHPDTEDIKKKVKKILYAKNKKIQKGKNCRDIGDIIISLEMPESCTLYSTDGSHIPYICTSLKKPFLIEKYPNYKED